VIALVLLDVSGAARARPALADRDVGQTVYDDRGRPGGIVAGPPERRFQLRRFVLVNAAGHHPSDGRQRGARAKPGATDRPHVSGVGGTYSGLVLPMMTQAGVETLHVTPDHPAFRVRWRMPEWLGAVGLSFNPLPQRVLRQLYGDLDPRHTSSDPTLSASRAETAVHVAEPLFSWYSTNWLGSWGDISSAVHTRYEAFARQFPPSSGVGRTVRVMDRLGAWLPRIGIEQRDFDDAILATERMAHRRAKTVMTRSPDMIALLSDHGFGSTERQRLHLWPGSAEAISPEQAMQPKRDAPFLAAMSGTSRDVVRERFPGGRIPRPILLYWGRLSPEKGVEQVIDLQQHAGRMLEPGETGGPTIFIIGTGSASYEAELVRLNERLGGRAVFLGPRFDPEKSELIRNADVGLLPGWGETFGLTRIEAPANGLPFVGVPDLGFGWIAGPSGVEAKSRSGAALADAVREGRTRDPLEGLRYVRDNFSPERSWQAFLEGLSPFGQ